MIAKKISMQSVSKSSFVRLVNYIANEQGKEQRVSNVRITNCISNDIEWAKLEIQATQKKNTRSGTDKTYHLLLSFPVGEMLTNSQLHNIEDKFCKALGYEEHQRISAIHTDTDNLHIHIAINKIHPKSFKSYEPFNDYKTLSSVCSLIESEYDLSRTNHIGVRNRSQNKAQDMERFSGLESMVGWIKRECFQEINNTNNWADFKKVLSESNLYIRVKGNGFVIGDRSSGFEVKASTVDRSLSKPNLEKKFGAFVQDDSFVSEGIKRKYNKSPAFKGRIDTTELYASYLKEREIYSAKRTEQFRKLKSDHQKKILAAKTYARIKRDAVRLLSKGMSKKIAYAVISYELKKKIKTINANYKDSRNNLYQSTKPLIWNDWLKREAINGNSQAAKVLQQQNFRKGDFSIYGDKELNNEYIGNIDSITRRGSFIFKTPGIRDVGSRIDIIHKTDDASILEALKIAQGKYGKKLKIDGDDLFKQQIVRVAARAKLNIQFDNIGMERHRQILIKEQIENERKKQRTRDFGNGSVRADSNERGNRTVRDGSTNGSRTTSSRSRSEGFESFDRDSQRNKPILYAQSNISEFTSRTPTTSLHSMPGLSAGNVASLEDRNKMLLQSDAYNNLDIQESSRNDGMRWAAYFNGLAPEKREAILIYVSERNNKQNNLKQVFDIPKHSVYNVDINGDVRFMGVRKINNQNLVLLQKDGDDTIYVKDASPRELSQLKKLRLQSSVNIDNNGIVSLKNLGKKGRGKK